MKASECVNLYEREYCNTADKVVKSIIEVSKEHPEILDIEDIWDLFKFEKYGFKAHDCTLFQAQWALATARERQGNG